MADFFWSSDAQWDQIERSCRRMCAARMRVDRRVLCGCSCAALWRPLGGLRRFCRPKNALFGVNGLRVINGASMPVLVGASTNALFHSDGGKGR